MKVLTVTVSLDPRDGGKPARTVQLSKALRTAGFDVGILSTSKGVNRRRPPVPNDVPVTLLRLISRRFFVPFYFPGHLRSLVAEYDVVQLMGHWNVLNVLAWRAARSEGVPVVVCPAGELAMAGRSRPLKWVFQRVVGRRIVRDASGHIVIAENEIADYAVNGIPASQVTLLPNGIDPQSLAPGDAVEFRRRFELGDGAFILFVGRLDPVKGPDLLLDAFLSLAGKYPDYQIVFAGPDDGALSSLKQSLEGNPSGLRVHFTGFLDNIDKATAYAAAELVVVPSRREAMSLIVVEAGVLGRPVLITDQCGLDQLAEAGAVFQVPASIEGLRSGLETLLDDADLRDRLGERLRDEVRCRYTWHRVAELAGSFFRSVGKKLPSSAM